ncbi:MAG: 16S rRNA (guanine(527)-N(7))-methyltransferase RsmG, partial [Calditrichaeota bacterium]|nr:16S rRNA (guanine(527)-N(7))-methyltransferase RsmG [Calditrichota bacterium]
MKIEQIVLLLEKEGIAVNKRQADQLKQYVKLLRQWNTKIRLISKGDQNFVEERHILPSFMFAKFLSDNAAGDKQTVLDIGSGAGLPGVVLAI